MTKLVAGQKVRVSDILSENKFYINAMLNMDGCDIDISCFGVDGNGKLSDDRYFVFYNQLSTPEGAVIKEADKDIFLVDLQKIPDFINKLVITAAIDGEKSLSHLKNSSVVFGNNEACYEFSGEKFKDEKAIIIAELYKNNDQWKISVIGSGFNGGLNALLSYFGGEETKEEASSAKPVQLKKSDKVQKVVLEKAPHLVDLTKKAIVSLEKKNLMEVKAQVLLVLDVSGSMYRQYRKGRVQRILDKMLPLALLFDDDGSLESWAFADTSKRLDDANVDNIKYYIETVNKGWKNWNVGVGNNEPEVMKDIIHLHKKSNVPVYIIFISDGGIYKNNEIEELIRVASHMPMFWQFIGIHGSNYGALKKIDEMRGRYVDNANFFALDDIDSISDEELYDRMMNEFPQWLKAAKEKNII